MWIGRNFPRDRFVTKKIRILTYSSFAGPLGPGDPLIERFKKAKNCDVEVVTTTDAGLLLERLRLAQASMPVDAVIGLDQLQLADATAQSNWTALPTPPGDLHEDPLRGRPGFFLPFDWSPMTFVYRRGDSAPPAKFAELADPKYKGQFALQDPRTSTPGMQFFDWVRAIEGSHTTDFLTRFKPNVQSISPSWAFSYGLFKKKQAKFVFSYLTSLAFHWGFEKDRNYQVVSFSEGHPVQIEYAGVPGGCRECELGREFVTSMLDPEAQKIIMEKDYMFPVLKGVEKGTIFEKLPRLKTRTDGLSTGRDLSDWDKVFKQ